jgi:branched-chain amino acid transport system substrate-binding protein
MRTGAILLGSLIALAGTGPVHAADIKLGVSVPLTGYGASYGEDAKRAVDLAVEQVNAAGGIKGDKIQTIVEDDAGQGKEGVAAIRKLIGTDKVQVVLSGMMSTAALPQAPIARESKVVYISTMSSHPDLTSPGGYIYRMSNTDALVARAEANFAAQKLNAKTAAGIFAQTDYGLNNSKSVRATFEASGGKWLGQDEFKQGATDFKTQIAKIKQLNPDMFFIVATHKEAAQMFRQMIELNFKPPTMGTSMLDDPAFFDLAGDTGNGVYMATNIRYQTPETAKLRADYMAAFKAKYGRDPGVTADFYYDAVRLAVGAITAVGPNGPAINKWLADANGYPGVITTYSFNNIGDAIIPVVVKQIDGRTFKETGYSEK